MSKKYEKYYLVRSSSKGQIIISGKKVSKLQSLGDKVKILRRATREEVKELSNAR